LDQQWNNWVLRANRIAFSKLSRAFARRRSSLVSHLSYIFPIELVDATEVLFSIIGVPLPNSSFDPSGADDDVVSSGLGLVALLVNTLATYLAVPIHYPVKPIGSRSLILDPISMMKGPRS
jgi:hypothetical protein